MENNENQTVTAFEKAEKTGGLYSKVKMSLKTANILVCVTLLLLIAVTIFLVRHNGFTVQFDTNGGSYVESCKAMHSETVSPPTPVKEGYVFTGWYLDRDCTVKWDVQNDKVTQSLTLYAGWEEAQ